MSNPFKNPWPDKYLSGYFSLSSDGPIFSLARLTLHLNIVGSPQVYFIKHITVLFYCYFNKNGGKGNINIQISNEND